MKLKTKLLIMIMYITTPEFDKLTSEYFAAKINTSKFSKQK